MIPAHGNHRTAWQERKPMKISDIRCVEYTGSMPADGPFWADRLRRPTDLYPEFAATGPSQPAQAEDGGHQVRTIFLHVDTDDGRTGSTAVLSPEQAAVITTGLKPLLIGADVLATERIWDICYRGSIHGRKGVGMVALSAVDCALWDLRGQHFGVPVHVLLGGPTRESVPAYCSMLGDSLEPAAVAAATEQKVAEGFTGLKWFPRWGPNDGVAGVDKVVELVGTVRDAAGPGLDIMLDAWSSWDIPFTVAVVRATEGLGLRWIEEPLLADDASGYRVLRQRVGGRTEIVGGEHEYTRWGFARLIEDGALDLYQPDPHWAGGISELLKISALISAAGAQLIPHGQSLQCNAALTFAAAPALIPQMEYLHRLMPSYQHFLAAPIAPVFGRIAAPALPGLGMELRTGRILASRTIG
jgi:L-alanine-DL-glutamate epimerase-like enolase superfamily enzyme